MPHRVPAVETLVRAGRSQGLSRQYSLAVARFLQRTTHRRHSPLWMAAENLAALLAHADWLRDLARKLVGGADADDAVQETFVAALRSPPDPDLPVKPWLARVLRNASRMAHRNATRRARREHAVTQIATPPSSATDTVARAETFR